jgi:hypothetical protein
VNTPDPAESAVPVHAPAQQDEATADESTSSNATPPVTVNGAPLSALNAIATIWSPADHDTDPVDCGVEETFHTLFPNATTTGGARMSPYPGR